MRKFVTISIVSATIFFATSLSAEPGGKVGSVESNWGVTTWHLPICSIQWSRTLSGEAAAIDAVRRKLAALSKKIHKKELDNIKADYDDWKYYLAYMPRKVEVGKWSGRQMMSALEGYGTMNDTLDALLPRDPWEISYPYRSFHSREPRIDAHRHVELIREHREQTLWRLYGEYYVLAEEIRARTERLLALWRDTCTAVYRTSKWGVEVWLPIAREMAYDQRHR